MKARPTVSVAMATFNGAKHLPEQLESLVRQSYLPTDLVVSDDGSEDATVEILDAFSRVAPFRVRVLGDQSRLGVAGNFERALRACTGDLVFFSDQDDVWYGHKIERVSEVMSARPHVQLIVHDRLITDGSLASTGISTLTALHARGGSINDYVAGSSTAMRRSLVELALPFPDLASVAHDAWMHMLARSLSSAYVLDEPLMFYRRHGGNASRSSVEPGRSKGRARALQSLAFRILASLSGNARSRQLMQHQALNAELASRLRTPEAQAISADAREAAVEADRRAAAYGLRCAGHREAWYRRVRALERARRMGAYSKSARGLAAYGLDLLTPRWRN